MRVNITSLLIIENKCSLSYWLFWNINCWEFFFNLTVVFICIFLIHSCIEHVFIYFLAICMSSFFKLINLFILLYNIVLVLPYIDLNPSWVFYTKSLLCSIFKCTVLWASTSSPNNHTEALRGVYHWDIRGLLQKR